jgi:penicillin-binding protein 1A
MTSALSVDRARGPELPIQFTQAQRRQSEQLKSPLPPDWSNATKPLRDIAQQLHDIFR